MEFLRSTLLFEDDNYRVIEYFKCSEAPTIVAFNGAGAKPFSRGNTGVFGDKASLALGCNFIGVLKNNNDWYQSDSIRKVIDTIKKLERKTIITYGASMGGYAAINFSIELKSDFFIAICPQFTINPNYMNRIGDPRWRNPSLSTKFVNDNIFLGLTKESKGLVIYDSTHQLDNIHAQDIKKYTSAELIDCIGEGHMAGKSFNQLYGLKRLMEEVINSKLDVALCRDEINEKQKLNPRFLFLNATSSTEKINILLTYSNSVINFHILSLEILYFENKKRLSLDDAKLLFIFLRNLKDRSFVSRGVSILIKFGYLGMVIELKKEFSWLSLINYIVDDSDIPIIRFNSKTIGLISLRKEGVRLEREGKYSLSLAVLEIAKELKKNGVFINKKITELNRKLGN